MPLQARSATLPPASRATLDDLLRTPGKAELIDGKIVHLMATGFTPNRVAGRIFRSLDDYAEMTGVGFVFTDNMGFAVPQLTNGRQSFSPDASYYAGPLPANLMRFVAGPPTLAVEVRSEGDYGPVAEADLAAKRADYFEAGTLAVWDVDPVAECVHLYLPELPQQPTTFRRGETATAGPGLPGWECAVDPMFR